MFWIIVLHLATADAQDIPVIGPPVAFISERECDSAVEILKAAGHASAECKIINILSDKAEAF